MILRIVGSALLHSSMEHLCLIDRVQGSGFRVLGSGFLSGLGFRQQHGAPVADSFQGLGFRVQGSGLGFRVQGSGFKV